MEYGRIRFLEKNNDAIVRGTYLKVIKQQVKWSANSLFGGIFYLQDNGAPCHRSKTVKDFVRQQLLEDFGLAASVPRSKPH